LRTLLQVTVQQKGTSVPFFIIFIRLVINNRKYDIGEHMFNKTKYTKTYYEIVDRSKNRQLTEYKERHHIIPQSLGGSNKKENLTYLTAREHFICHWLLIKMTLGSDKAKMLYALNMMRVKNDLQERYSTKITSRVYENYRKELRKIISKTNKGRIPWNKGGAELTDQQRENIKQAALTRKVDPLRVAEGQRKRIEKVKGQKRTDATRKKMSESHIGKIKGPQSDEHKLAISLASKGIKKKEGHSDNVRNAVKGNISINKDGLEKKVKKDALQSYLDDGWQLGGKKRKLA